jgi:hypothetical protein
MPSHFAKVNVLLPALNNVRGIITQNFKEPGEEILALGLV